MVAESIVSVVQGYLRNLRQRGVAVRSGVVFGSQATGKTHRWSDIDLLVLSPDFDRAFSRAQVDLLWHVAAETDSRIEPVPCGEKQWEQDRSSAIIEIARREGEVVSIEGEAPLPAQG